MRMVVIISRLLGLCWSLVLVLGGDAAAAPIITATATDAATGSGGGRLLPPLPPSPSPLPPFSGVSTRQKILATIWESGKISTRSIPDSIVPVHNVSLAPHARQITWNISGQFFPLTSTTFYNPRSASGRTSDTIVLHHHGHAKSCDNAAGCPIWFDFYNVTSFIHDELEADYFMLYMPLLGPNQQHGYPEHHQWFNQWEAKGDKTIRYFVEPLHLTVNYALALGYKRVVMMGKSGGGWTTTVCSALDPRIDVSFPIAGSIPLAFHHVSLKCQERTLQPRPRYTYIHTACNANKV
jgi:hypothetical protein